MNRDGLKSLLAELAAEEREDRGPDAISDDDLLAYRAGGLDDERSQMVMRVLATEPEWADRMLELARFEAAAAEAQVEPQELEREWRALDATLEAPAGRLLPFRRWIARRPLSSVAAAALIGLALSLLSFLQTPVLPRPQTPQSSGFEYSLELGAKSDVRAGAPKTKVIPVEVDLVKVTLRLPRTHRNDTWEAFRVELRDPSSSEPLVDEDAMSSNKPEVEFEIRRNELTAGVLYEVNLFLAGSKTVVAEYRFQVDFEGPII